MPKNKRESLIYTVLMCFTMVLWMSIYNVAIHQGELSLSVLKDAWMGLPIAYVFAMACDWFLVSGLGQGVCLPLSGEARSFQPSEDSHRCVQLHG